MCVRGVMRECHSRQELWKVSWKWHSDQRLKKMGGAGDDPEERQVLARGALEEQRGGLREVAPPTRERKGRGWGSTGEERSRKAGREGLVTSMDKWRALANLILRSRKPIFFWKERKNTLYLKSATSS